jgi:hypothetical protein
MEGETNEGGNMTVDEFKTWARTAKPGDTCVYHDGYLAYDARGDSELTGLASVVLAAAQARLVHLTQKRIVAPEISGSVLARRGTYEYRATRSVWGSASVL